MARVETALQATHRYIGWRKLLGLGIVLLGSLILAREFWLYAVQQPVNV